MKIDGTTDIADFRRQVQQWIGDQAPAELPELTDWSGLLAGYWWDYPEEMATVAYKQWETAMLEERLICGHWPARYGGRDLTSDQSAVIDQECMRANVPRIFRDQGEAWVGPSILAHGSEEQKDHFLPRIVSGVDTYCQGFSEPNHGSDLASLETRGVVDGDRIVINGQKIWTTYGGLTSKIFILCRTDPDRSLRHRGLTFVIADVAEAGASLEFRSIRDLTGESDFAETFINDLSVPLDNVIGGVGNGWSVAMTTLDNERGGRAAEACHAVYTRDFADLVRVAEQHGRTADPDIRRRFVDLYATLQAMKHWGETGAVGVHGSVEKNVSHEWPQRFGRLAMTVLGEEAGVRPAGEAKSGYALNRWQNRYFRSLAGTIASGASEIQRNVIAERALGMPREPRG